MAKFDFNLTKEYIGFWNVRGTIEADDIESAREMLLEEEFDEDECDWDDGYTKEWLSVYQYNGDELYECLLSIYKSTKEIDTKVKIENCFKEMKSVITITDLE